MHWLRHSLDEISTVINIDDDKPTEDPQVDVHKAAVYISQYLKRSSLEPYVNSDSTIKLSDYKNRGESIFELYYQGSKPKSVPGFRELAEYLDELCKTVFSKPQAAMRQQLRISNPLLLSSETIAIMDTKMVKKDLTYVCLYSGEENFGKITGILACFPSSSDAAGYNSLHRPLWDRHQRWPEFDFEGWLCQSTTPRCMPCRRPQDCRPAIGDHDRP